MKLAISRKNLWHRLQPGPRTLLGRLLGIVPVQYLLGRRFRETLRFAVRSQWWPVERIRAYQLKQLQRICTIAQQSPFYARLFKKAGFVPGDLRTVECLSYLPTIDKLTIREHLAEMCTVSPWRANVDKISTGGTSGMPLQFYINADRSATEYAYLTASWHRAGYRLQTPLAVFRGRVVPVDRSGMHHEYDAILRHHFYSSFHMTDSDMARYVEHISGIGPCYLHVYPSTGAALTRFILRSGYQAPANIRGIIAESETVYPQQRQKAEEVFCCRYLSCYGQSEKLVLAAECEHSTDYHVWPTYGYFELLDASGRPVTRPGESGEIVGTGFINSIVPFIRYRTGDFATYVADHCDRCGRAHPIIRDIQGHRTQEVLITRGGSMISWAAMNMHDDTFARVRQFQFRQDTPGQAVLRIVPAEGFGEANRRRILANLGQKLDWQIDLDIELTDSIALSPRGKAVYVDQRIVPQVPEGEKEI
ncbi:MAG: phenylacetate--CoA ligase family protein [Planctomycetes bacterium]|nr:phenylacetate--CoA ligase family protein [Planctomycetota bacterium]